MADLTELLKLIQSCDYNGLFIRSMSEGYLFKEPKVADCILTTYEKEINHDPINTQKMDQLARIAFLAKKWGADFDLPVSEVKTQESEAVAGRKMIVKALVESCHESEKKRKHRSAKKREKENRIKRRLQLNQKALQKQKEQLSSQLQQLSQLQTQLNESKQKEKELYLQIEISDEKKSELEETLNAANRLIEKNNEEIGKLSKELETEKEKSFKKPLKNQMSEIQMELDRLRVTFLKLNTNIFKQRDLVLESNIHLAQEKLNGRQIPDSEEKNAIYKQRKEALDILEKQSKLLKDKIYELEEDIKQFKASNTSQMENVPENHSAIADKLAALQAILKSVQADREQISQSVAELADQLAEVKAEKEVAIQEIEISEQDKRTLQQELVASRALIKTNQEKIDSVSLELEKEREKNAKKPLKDQLSEMQMELDRLRVHLLELNHQASQQRSLVFESMADLADETINGRMRSNSKVKIELFEQRKEELERLETVASILKDNIERLKEDIAGFKIKHKDKMEMVPEDNSALTEELNQLRKELMEGQDNREKLSRSILELTQQLEKEKSEKEVLKKEKQSLEETVQNVREALKKQLEEQKDELKKLKQSAEKIDREKDDLQRKVEVQTSKLQVIKDYKSQLEAQLAQQQETSEHEKEELMAEIEKKKSLLIEAHRALVQLDYHSTEKSKQARIAESIVRAKEEELKKIAQLLRIENQELKDQTTQLQEKINKLINYYEEKQNELTEKNQKLEETIKRLEKEKEDERKRNKKLTVKVADLERENHQLQKGTIADDRIRTALEGFKAVEREYQAEVVARDERISTLLRSVHEQSRIAVMERARVADLEAMVQSLQDQLPPKDQTGGYAVAGHILGNVVSAAIEGATNGIAENSIYGRKALGGAWQGMKFSLYRTQVMSNYVYTALSSSPSLRAHLRIRPFHSGSPYYSKLVYEIAKYLQQNQDRVFQVKRNPSSEDVNALEEVIKKVFEASPPKKIIKKPVEQEVYRHGTEEAEKALGITKPEQKALSAAKYRR